MTDAVHDHMLSFAELDAVVSAMHGEEPRNPALLARFKHLWRLDVLERRPGRGSRVGYSIDEALRIVMVFELTSVGTPPARIAAQVGVNWSWISTDLRAGFRVAAVAGEDAEDPMGAFPGADLLERAQLLVVLPGLLGESGRGENYGVMMSMARDVVLDFFRMPWTGRLASQIIVDPVVVAMGVRRALSKALEGGTLAADRLLAPWIDGDGAGSGSYRFGGVNGQQGQ